MRRGSYAEEVATALKSKPGIGINRKTNNDPAMNPGICLICKQPFDVLTYPHAKRCSGLDDKYEMIRRGMVKQNRRRADD